MALRHTPAKNLDKFICKHLQSDEAFMQDVENAIELINGFLKERCFFPGTPFPVRVSEVVKGHFSSKGPTLKNQYNADLVIFLANLRSFQDQILRREEFITEIRKDLEAFQRCTKTQIFEFKIKVQDPSDPRALSFRLSFPFFLQTTVEFNVLLAFDALGQVTEAYRPDPEIYVRLITECTSQHTEGEFSTCFTELQKDFVKRRPTKVKSLIRLVKHWYLLCKEKLGGPLPAQYALELLTIHAWESWSNRPRFNMAQGFKTILELVTRYQQLSIYWTEYYDFENPKIRGYLISQLMKPRPVILDPADPTRNLGGEDPESWPRLAQKAEAWLSYPCVQGENGFYLESWGCARLKQKMRSMGCSGRRRISPRIQALASIHKHRLNKHKKPDHPQSCYCLAYQTPKKRQ